MLERKVTMSGVVRPVVTWSSAVVTPSVPIARRAVAGHPPELARQLDVEVLPLVPVTATIVWGKGAKNLAASSAKAGAAPRRRYEPRLRPRLGPRTTATAPRRPPPDEILAVEQRALEGAEHVPGATLRWSMAKPVTESVDPAARSRRRIGSMLRSARGRTAAPRPCRLAALVGRTPSIGAIRLMTTPTTGATFQRRCGSRRFGRSPWDRRAWRPPHSAARPSGTRPRRS
jgi:hypothetical protein